MKKKHYFLNPECSNDCSKVCSSVFSKRPFVPAVLRTASTHYILRVPVSVSFKKVAKRQLSHSLIPLHFVPLHSFIRSQTFLHILASSQGGLCSGQARSNASTVSPVASCICFTSLRSSTPLCGLPVSAGGPLLQ